MQQVANQSQNYQPVQIAQHVSNNGFKGGPSQEMDRRATIAPVMVRDSPSQQKNEGRVAEKIFSQRMSQQLVKQPIVQQHPHQHQPPQSAFA